MIRNILLTACLGAVSSTGFAAGPEWPQFRGPNGSGIAVGAKPPVTFGPDQNVKWKVPVPSGASSPVIVGDKLYLTAFDEGKLFTIAYSTTNGRELWRAEAPAKAIEAYHKTEGSPAASSVATDGKTVVAYFGSCGLFAYDLTGKELWKYELPMAKTAADFGTGVSPLLVDGLVVLQRDEMNQPQIVVLDAATGRPKWEVKRPPATSYCTPAVWDTAGGKQIVCGGYGRMVSYDLQTGEEKWSVAGMPSATCTTPVVGDGMLYFSGWSPGDAEDSEFKFPKFDDLLESGDVNKDGQVSRDESEKTFLKGFFDSNDTDKNGQLTREEWDAIIKYMSAGKNSVFAVKAGGHGDITKTHVAWKKTKGMPYVPSAILVGGQYFMVKDGGLCTAYDAVTGKEIYVQKRAVAAGRYYASPVSANGNVYVVSLDDGTFTVLKAGTDQPEVVAENPKLDEKTSATPAIVGDTIYVRTANHLWAFAETR
ncbi:outer membrane protein assembly factor BamB family protein [Schlesneria paludicola]|uniref:outer membrane protein assembly factor BamB family protein n=1 Tax=Schlesneria paludicola TaxID=360056 RepID=UPI00029B04C7|nr:PQQ-binding-like beta-propeller repeat protein [Schlesneria paludicola]